MINPQYYTQHSVTTTFEKTTFQITQSLKALKKISLKDVQIIITYPNNDIGKEDIGCSTHPHNIFLQVFLEYGILGIIIYLTILTQVIFKFFFNILEYNKRELPIYKNKNLSLVFLYLRESF